MNPRPPFSSDGGRGLVSAAARNTSAVSKGAEVHAGSSSLEFSDLLRIARAARTDTDTVRRLLASDATGTLQARQVRALATEALGRAHPSRRVRVAPQEART